MLAARALAEKLALKYVGCQILSSSLTQPAGALKQPLAPAVSCCQCVNFQQFIKHLGL
jgi:hypothetical protein